MYNHGEAISYKRSCFSSQNYEGRFNFWNDAVQQGVMTPILVRNISQADLLSNLRLLSDEADQTPTTQAMRQPSLVFTYGNAAGRTIHG